VAIDPSGNGVAIWNFTSIPQIQALSFTNGQWQPIDQAIIISDPSTIPYGIASYGQRLALDDSGNGFAVWSAQYDTGTVVQARRYVNRQWAETTNLSAADQQAFLPKSAVNGTGDAIVTWRLGTVPGLIQATTYTQGQWSTQAVTLSNPSNDATSSQVAIDSVGNGFVIWPELDSVSGFELIKVSRLENGTWSTPITLSPLNASSFQPQIAISPDNHAVAIWVTADTNFIVYSAEWINGEWVTSASPVSEVGSNAFDPQLGLDSIGNPVATWVKNIVAPYYVQAAYGFHLPTPTSVTVKQIVSKFSFQTEVFNEVSWKEFGGPFIGGHRIYKNGVLIAEIGPYERSYRDPNQVKGESVTYGVSSFLENGFESPIVTASSM
jgi:hypothetical protein